MLATVLALAAAQGASAVGAAQSGSVSVTKPAVATSSAEALIEQGTLAMRTDPDASKRYADRALELLRQRPDADLEIRARLLICDYESERDTAAAAQTAAAASTQDKLKASVMNEPAVQAMLDVFPAEIRDVEEM